LLIQQHSGDNAEEWDPFLDDGDDQYEDDQKPWDADPTAYDSEGDIFEDAGTWDEDEDGVMDVADLLVSST
jgi:hypothetical protein